MSLSPSFPRALGLSLLAGGAVVALSGCGVLNGVLGAASGQDDVFNLEVGNCFIEADMNASLTGDEVSEVPTVDCAEEHDSEVYHSEMLPDGDFPGAESVTDSGMDICKAKFEDFMGIAYDDSELYFSFFSPTSQSWDAMGDREILCYILTDEMVTGSLAGAAR